VKKFEGLLRYVAFDAIAIIALLAAIQLVLALIGKWLPASPNTMRETEHAQAALMQRLILNFGEARIDVRRDCSAYAYISKSAFLNVPFPDRDAVISKVARVWCEHEEIRKPGNLCLLSKVELRDIRTGEDLASYRCWLH
jgi:hypothetical protein